MNRSLFLIAFALAFSFSGEKAFSLSEAKSEGDSLRLFALSVDEAPEEEDEEVEEPEKKGFKSKAKGVLKDLGSIGQNMRRQRHHGMVGHLSLVDTWVPGKIGLAYSYNVSPGSTWELEYTRGSISFKVFDLDIGGITEERFSLVRRSYGKKNSFHFIYGINYSQIDAHLGNSLLDTATGNGRLNLLKVSSAGLTWGLGNRWFWKNGFAFGIDWFSIQIPLFNKSSSAPAISAVSDADDREEIRDILDIFEDIPTISAARLQLAYYF